MWHFIHYHHLTKITLGFSEQQLLDRLLNQIMYDMTTACQNVIFIGHQLCAFTKYKQFYIQFSCLHNRSGTSFIYRHHVRHAERLHYRLKIFFRETPTNLNTKAK